MTEEERQLSLLKGPRQKGEKAPMPSEFQIQCAVADALRVGVMPGWLWTAFPAGEYRTDETGRRLKRMGLKRGFFDMLLIGPMGNHCWLELKRGLSPLTHEQLAFKRVLEERHIPHAVARSFDEAIAVLKGWGAIKVSLADQLGGHR